MLDSKLKPVKSTRDKNMKPYMMTERNALEVQTKEIENFKEALNKNAQ